jgi:hypothetical protein
VASLPATSGKDYSFVKSYEGLAYDRDELTQVMRRTYDELIDFVTSSPFQELMTEFSAMTTAERVQFVRDVLLSDIELTRRGVDLPEGVLIQRSAFGDRRPTLFVVKKFLPDAYRDVWENVNITFDDEFADSSVSRDAHISWRPPLRVDMQAQAMAEGRDLESV